MPNLLSDDRYNVVDGPTLKSYDQTWRDKLGQLLSGDKPSLERQNFVSGLLGSKGLGTTGLGLVDATPIGQVMGAQESIKEGDYQGAALAIIPPMAASKLAYPATAASNELLKKAVSNTKGARFVDDALVMNVNRNQLVEQAGEPSTRGGVFYLPDNSPYSRYYKNDSTKGQSYYGGTDNISGETAFYNPLFVKGQTGGKVPENAYIAIKGKKEFEAMQRDVQQYASGIPKGMEEESVARFLEQHAPEMVNDAWYIAQNSKRGNQLRYALQEAAVSSAVRNSGYDSVIGHSFKRDKSPFITEVFDVRESHYPDGKNYSIWDSIPVKTESGKSYKLTPIDYDPFDTVGKK
jgi:hypothetical protein